MRISSLHSSSGRVSFPAFAALLFVALLTATAAHAQVRERPVPFDSAGRVIVITPPLASRLGLSAPVWPVDGDYLDARLYALDGAPGAASFVLVVRRQRDVLDRYPLEGTRRRELARAVDRGNTLAMASAGADTLPTYISEPVRGSYVVNQTVLGVFLFGPYAAASLGDPTAAAAAYLSVAGGTFFMAANLTKTSPVSRAQNHLSWHSARRGAIAGGLAAYSLAGNGLDSKISAASILAGGIAGDYLGFVLGEPMTDAEAHGTSHGSTVTAALAAGALGATGFYKNEGSGRLATSLIIGAGALGYPLGLKYVRSAHYRVTDGDVGTLVTSELLGMGAVATLLPDKADETLAYAAVTTGFALGAIAGDQWLVRPFDHTESEARLLQVGAFAGALVASALPVLAQSSNPHLVYGAITVGGILGTIMTEGLIEPQKASFGVGLRGSREGETVERTSRVSMRFSPESLVFVKMGVRGNHSIFSLGF